MKTCQAHDCRSNYQLQILSIAKYQKSNQIENKRKTKSIQYRKSPLRLCIYINIYRRYIPSYVSLYDVYEKSQQLNAHASFMNRLRSF